MALVTTQSKPFIQLVDLQQKSLNTLNSIKDSVAKTADSKASRIQADQLDQLKKLLDVQRDSFGLQKKAADKKDMGEISKSMKNWKTWGDKIKDMTRAAADAINPTNISKKLFGAFNVGGIFNKKIAAIDYKQQRKALGDTGPDLNKRSKQYANSLYSGLRAQDQLDKMRATGASDDDIKSTKKGRGVLKAVNQAGSDLAMLGQGQALGGKSAQDAANKMGGNTAGRSVPLPKTPSDKGQVAQSTTDLAADQQAAHESQMEMIRLNGLQTDLLAQIAANTSALRPGGSSAGGAEDSGKSAGGVGDSTGFGKSIKGIGSSMKGFASGAMAAGIGIGKFFTGIMAGIADGIAEFGKGKTLKGVAVLGLLTGVMWGFTEVVSKWAKMDWDTIAKAGLALGGLVAIGFVAGKAFEGLMLGALGLGALGAAVWVIGKGMDSMGDGLANFADGLERLSNIKAGALLDVAGGLTALGAAFAVFGAGTAAAGLGSFVGNLLTKVTGGKSPVEQIVDIGQAGPGVQQAANGIGQLAGAMKQFAGLDKDSLKPLKQFPWEEATKFVAAGGSMTVKGATVTQASKSNADSQAAVNAQKSAPSGGTNVSTAVQNNTTNNNVVKLPSRNTESSYSQYSMSRY